MGSTLVVSFWALYIDYIVFTDENRLKRLYIFYFMPPIVMTILGIINFFTPVVFTINEANEYARVAGIWAGIILPYIVYIYIAYIVYKHRKQLSNNFLIGVVMFLSLPLAAGIIQLLFLGLTLIWPVTAMAIIFTYLLFETTSSSLDYLTGIHTRVRAEDYMNRLQHTNKPYSVIMMDMDDFKHLNDTYGHNTGDNALIEMARILKQAFERKDIVARFGGDEFLVVTEGIDVDCIFEKRQLISELMANSKNDYIKKAKFSMGVALCKNIQACTIEELLIEADNNMYIDKAKNKNFKRRSTDS
jgi:diguanylate cyclase (GGDEF)-like protein